MKTLRDILGEKTLTPAEKKKREEIAQAMEKDNPGMDMGKKMAIATATAKKVAEDKDPCWDSHEMIGMKTKNGKKVPNCVPKNEEAEQFCQACCQTPCVCGGNHVEEGTGSLKPGWMLKADPKLAAKVAANKAKHAEKKRLVGSKPSEVKEGMYKAELEGLPPTFVSGDSVSDVRAKLRAIVKKPAEQIHDIQRVQPAQMKKYFRDMSTGKEEMEESFVTEAEMPDQTMDLSYLEESLADAYMMQFMAHQFHWNVKGQDFIQYHEFLESLYKEVHEEVDGIAEQIRINGKAAPISLISLIELSNIDEQETVVTTPQQMMTALEDANDEVILSLYGALDVATEANAQGLINFLADRIDAHAKISWKLSSSQE
jgi:starvation-inducible DNA-binding protein